MCISTVHLSLCWFACSITTGARIFNYGHTATRKYYIAEVLSHCRCSSKSYLPVKMTQGLVHAPGKY